MTIENHLDSLHAKARKIRLLQYFAVFNRIILAVSFIPSGMTKLLGYRFTQLSTDYPAGYFFESFYQTGGWYRFVGFCQVLAAILLLAPRTATLGAAVFFPIVLNIMLITISVDFQATWMITSLMFLANLYLICWDYDKFKLILPLASEEKKPFIWRKYALFVLLGTVGGALAFLFFAGVTFYFHRLGVWGVIGGAVAGAFVGLINARELQKTESKSGKPDQARAQQLTKP